MNASTRVPAAEITGFTGGLMKMASRKMIGQVPDSLGVLWHHRRVLQDLMGIGRKSERRRRARCHGGASRRASRRSSAARWRTRRRCASCR